MASILLLPSQGPDVLHADALSFTGADPEWDREDVPNQSTEEDRSLVYAVIPLPLL